jgi:hypothetical protein
MYCPKCGRNEVEPHPTDSHLCVDCVKAENNRLTYYRQHQDDWLAVAKESGLDPWAQQPGETQWEYTVWTTYRDSYPGKRPNYADVSRQLETTYNVVKKIAQRWTFPTRMQLWMKFVDDTTLAQRRQEILDMNKEHIDMAALLNTKIKAAINAIDPNLVKPAEIASLMKTAAELERKARIDTENQEEIRRGQFIDTDIKQSKKQANATDLSEVVQILAKAGVLDGMKMKQTTTTTTEISVDNSVTVEAEVIEDEDI